MQKLEECRLVWLAALLACPWCLASLRADIVITEIHYAPAAADGTPRTDLEFVEIFNDGPEAYDLSGYYFTRGLAFIFDEGEFIDGRSFLVICRDEAAVRAEYGITNTLGDFTGALDNSGETIELSNPQGVPVTRVDYNDRGQWPGGAKGTGHSLSILSEYSEPDDPDNWTLSTQRGGTPGAVNFDQDLRFVETTLVPDDAVWRYLKGTSNPPSSWTQPGFNDTSWASGPTGIGYGDGDDRTELNDMRGAYLSVFCRHRFTIDDLSGIGQLILLVSYDDGFVVHVNGSEVSRVNMPSGSITSDTAAAGTVGDAPAEPDAEITIPLGLLNEGENVLAASVHNTGLSSSDLTFLPRLVDRREVQPESIATVPVCVNEGHFRTSTGRFVELYNDSDSSVDLSGFHLTNDFADLTLFDVPAGTRIAARGFLAFTEAELGLDLSIVDGVRERVEVALVNPAGTRVVDARIFEPKHEGLSEARFPDGDDSFAPAATPTPGAVNEVPVVRDIVFNEIMYHPITGRDSDEFIELYNRGDVAHDISGWRIDGVGDYEFPPGTELGPGEYLVVAKDPAQVRSTYGLDGTVLDAPYSGGLSDGGERLRLRDLYGNTADLVRYYDGGEWSRWTDGGGSSLERIDPFSESSVAASWDASDDSDDAVTGTYSYTAVHGGGESDFGMMLLDEGITIVDNVRLERVGTATNLISNGTFNASTSGWRIEGTHISSGRTADPAEVIDGAGSLKLISWNGTGDYKVNRIETDTGAQSSGASYRITFQATWKVGSASLLAIGDYNVGNPASAGLAGSTFLAVPRTLGTPGALNSVTRRQIDRFGSANMGPAIDRVEHAPCVPGGGESVTVEARVRDPDGVATVRLRFRTESVSGAFTQVNMAGPDAEGRYRGTIPGQPLGTRVIFFIEATDSLGRRERFPRDILSRSHPPVVDPSNAPATEEVFCLYRHDQRLPATSFHSYRFVLAEEHEAELRARRVLSNKVLEGSFIFGANDCYYGSGIRFAGSPWLRPGGGDWNKSYSIEMAKDRPLHGRKRAFNLDSHGTDGRERLSHFLFRRIAGTTRLPYFDFHQLVRFQLNDVFSGTREALDKPNRQYVDFWFPEDSDGPHYEMDDRFSFNDSGQRTGNAEGKVLYPPYGATSGGNDKENYRWYFALRNRKTEDDFQPLMSMCRVMDPRTTPNADFDTVVFQTFDVEELLRVWAIELNIDHWDTWGGNRGKNCYFFQAPTDRLWRLIPWDIELTYSQVTRGEFAMPTTPSGSIPNHFTEIQRCLNRPRIKRMYYGILKGMLDEFFYDGPGSPLTRYIAELSGSGVSGTGSVASFINSRRSYLIGRVDPAAYPQVRLRITTNGGADFTHTGPSPFLELAGDAPADVFRLRFLRNGSFLEEVDFQFSTSNMVGWTARDIPLASGENAIEVLGFNDREELVDSDSITVTSTAGFDPPLISGLAPNPIPAGDLLTIQGADFHAGLKVFFRGGGDFEAEEVFFDEGADPTTVRARVPEALPATVVTVEVENIDGQSSNPVALTVLPPLPRFIRGDGNRDGVVELSDAVKTVRHLFAGVPVGCRDALDSDDDGNLSVTDAIYLLDHLYRGGPAPPPPFPVRGSDPTAGDGLDCEESL